MNVTQFSPTVPGGRGPIHLSPLLASEFQKIAKEIGVTAAQIGQEALKDNPDGLIGLQLSEREFAYFKPQDYLRVKDEQIKSALGLKVNLLEEALKSPTGLKKQDLTPLIADAEISRQLKNNTNNDIQQLIQRIDLLREQLVSTLIQQESASAKKVEVLAKEAVKVETIKTETPPVQPVQQTAQRAHWLLRVVNAITKFFAIDIPNFFFQRIHGEKHLAKSFLTSTRVAEVVQGTLTSHAKIKSTFDHEKVLIDSGNPAFNEELRKDCNKKLVRLFDRLERADQFAHEVDTISIIDDKEIKKEISAMLASLKRLKESTQNCLKNATTPGERKKLEERLIKIEGAIFQVSTSLSETNQALRIDKANSTSEMLNVVEALTPNSFSKTELVAQIRGLHHQLTPLDEERAVIKETIFAIEKEILQEPVGNTWEERRDTFEANKIKFNQYQVILNLLKNQLKEIQSEAHSLLQPIKETLKDALRMQNISSRPDVRQSIRQLIAKQETHKEIDVIPAKKAEERELSQKMEFATEPGEYQKLSKQRDGLFSKFDYSRKLAAKLANPKALESNPRFIDNLHRAATILLKEEKKGVAEEKAEEVVSNALNRAEARSDSLKSFENIRKAVGMVRKEFFNEQEAWYQNSHALVLTAGKLIGEKQPSHIAFAERKEVDSGKSLTGIFNAQELNVAQYIAFRHDGKQKPLLHVPSQDLKNDELQLLLQRNQDLACFMFVKDKLRDKNLSVNDRAFLEKDFLELEQSLMKPPYMYMEKVLERNLESFHKQIKQFAVDYMIDGIGELPTELLDLRNHILAQMTILERTYRKELVDAIPPAPDETHPLDDLLQSLNQKRLQFEDLFQSNDFKDSRRIELAMDWINNSTLENFPSMERAMELYKTLSTLSSQREIPTSVPERAGAKFPLMEQVRQAKAHLQRMMPAIEETRDVAFIKDFITSNGRDQYYNTKTGKYATQRQEGRDWVTYRHNPHAINHVIKLIHKYKQYGFHDAHFTQEILTSDVIARRVPLQHELREILQGSIAVKEFVTQYNESIASGKIFWENEFDGHFVASGTRPEGHGWKEVPPWKASAKMIDYLFEPLEESNPLINDIYQNVFLLSQRLPTERDFAFLQQRVAEFEKATPTSSQEVEARLNETFLLLSVLKALTDEIDPNQYIEYFIRLKAIKEKTVELQSAKEAALALEFHNFTRSPQSLSIFANYDQHIVMHRAVTGKEKINPTYLPREAGKSANYPAPNLLVTRSLLENPLSIPVHYKLKIHRNIIESGDLDRAKLLAAYEYADKLLTESAEPSIFKSSPTQLSEADTAYLIQKRAKIKDLLLYPKTGEKRAPEQIKATVISLPKPTSILEGVTGFATIGKAGEKAALAQPVEDLSLAEAQELKASGEVKRRKWSESIQQRITQYDKFLESLQHETPTALLEHIQKDRKAIIEHFQKGERAIRDKAVSVGIPQNKADIDSPITLIEKAERLSNFNKAIGQAKQPDEDFNLISTFINDPNSFTEVGETITKVSQQSDTSQLLGERNRRETILQHLQKNLSDTFEEVKKLHMTDKSDITRYSEFKMELAGYNELFKANFKESEVPLDMAYDLRRLLNGIQHALDEKAELYRRKQGLPVETGRMKVVTFAEMRAVSRQANEKYLAAEKAKADALKANPPTASTVMKEITPLLKLPYKNQHKIKDKLSQLSKSLEDKSVKLTLAEIKSFRDSFQAMLDKEDLNPTRSNELSYLKHRYNHVDIRLKLYSLKFLNQPVEDQQKETTTAIPQLTSTAPKVTLTPESVAPKQTTPPPSILTTAPKATPALEIAAATPPKVTLPPETVVPKQTIPEFKKAAQISEPDLKAEEFIRAPLYRSPFTKPRDAFNFNKDNWTQNEIMAFAKVYTQSQAVQNPLWMRPKATETTFASSPMKPTGSWEQISPMLAAWRLINFISTEALNTEAEHKLLEALRVGPLTTSNSIEMVVENKLKELFLFEETDSKPLLEQGLRDLLALAVLVRSGNIDRQLSVSLMSRIVAEANVFYERSKQLK